MKALRTFFMEDWLESFRFNSKYNLGESGGRPRIVKDLLTKSGLTKEEAIETFLHMKLCDSPNRGRDDLRKLIAEFHPGASIDNVLITTGTSEALFLLFRHLNPKKVALALPAFQLLYELPQAIDAKIIPLPVRYLENGKPFIDEKEWLETIKRQKPDCLLINNPHNPSGLILNKEFIISLSLLANELGCYLIGDEHYRFLSSATETLGDTLYQNNENTFITGSFIKCFGAPGLRIGWCVGSKKALDSMQNEKNYTTHTVNPITEWIAYDILKNPRSELFYSVKNEWLENKYLLNQFLSHSQTVYGVSPNGGLVTTLGFQQAKTLSDAQYLSEKLLNNGIFTLPLSSMEFGSLNFQNERFYKDLKLSNINKGYGFRLGMGIEPAQFQKALFEIEATLT
jgi:aspartate/methionine/tyrosine aminotransferase